MVLGLSLFCLLGHLTHGLASLVTLELLLEFRIVLLLLHVDLHDLRLVDLLVNENLGVLARKLVLRYVGELLVHDGGLLALRIEDGSPLGDLSQAPDNRCVNEADGLIDIGVVNARDEGGLGLLDQVLLNDANAADVLDILVELGVDGHVLGSHSEALLVLVLVIDVDDEGNARGVLFHHVEHETHR